MSEDRRERERASRKLRALASGDFSLYAVGADGSLTVVRAGASGSDPTIAAAARRHRRPVEVERPRGEEVD